MRFKNEKTVFIVSAACRQKHPFAHAKAHLAWRQVGDHYGELALEVLRIVPSLNAGEDITSLAFADVNRESQKFSRAFHLFTLHDLSHAHIKFGEVIDCYFGSDGFAARFNGFGFLRNGRDERVELFEIAALHQVLEGLDLDVGSPR